MRRLLLLAGVCFCVFSGTVVRSQEPQPQQGTQFTGADPKIEVRTELNRGVQAFKSGRYDEATSAFQHAKELDPQLLNARLYLATNYASQYIPGAPSEENLRNGKQSVEEFRGALTLDPGNLNAIDGIGSILFQMAGTPFKPRDVSGVEVVPSEPHPN